MILELFKKQRAAKRLLSEVSDELNTAKNWKRAYEFIQIMCNTKNRLGHGSIRKLEITRKCTIRASIPWGCDGDGVFYFNRKILEDDEYFFNRIEKIKEQRRLRQERLMAKAKELELNQYHTLRSKYEHSL